MMLMLIQCMLPIGVGLLLRDALAGKIQWGRTLFIAAGVPVALMLLLGGAIGNLIDRVQLGYVIDFIDVHWRGRHWPAFNIADSAIVVGVTLMFIESLFEPRTPPRGTDEPESNP
ncbi:MAG: signal peptidase II, partial [Wenzhouxiangellaceae bacterium]